MERIVEELLLAHRSYSKSKFLFISALAEEGASVIALNIAESLQKRAKEEGISKVEFVDISAGQRYEVKAKESPESLLILGGGGLVEQPSMLHYLDKIDSAIFVVKAFETDRLFLNEAKEILDRHKVPLLGAVLNYDKKRIPSFLLHLTR